MYSLFHKMTFTLGLIYFGASFPAYGKQAYNSCCVCLYEQDTNWCSTILDNNKNKCDYNMKNHLFSFAKTYGINEIFKARGIPNEVVKKNIHKMWLPEDITCNTVNVFASHHGSPNEAFLPFEISKVLGEMYNPSEINFDGPACLIGNNVKLFSRWANFYHDRQAELPNDNRCKFTISSNQTVSGCYVKSGLLSNQFVEEMSIRSRVIAVIDHMGYKLRYEPCSPANSKCIHHPLYPDKRYRQKACYVRADYDQYLKRRLPLDRLRIAKQTCCIKKDQTDNFEGYWSKEFKNCGE